MKKILLSGLAVALTAGIVTIPNMATTDVANAQLIDLNITPNCPLNSFCAWSERNFTGTRTVFNIATLDKQCFINGNLTSPLNTQVGRSVRNNSQCSIRLYVQKNADGREEEASEVTPNSQLPDSGEFRSIRVLDITPSSF